MTEELERILQQLTEPDNAVIQQVTAASDTQANSLTTVCLLTAPRFPLKRLTVVRLLRLQPG